MDLDTKIKILVVDDMPNMRKTIKNMLRSIGFANIEEAADGEKALEKINSGGFGLVISDWKMPKMSGIQLLKKTRDNIDLKSIPFLIVTAEMSQSQIAQAAETEVDGYIIKPFNAATLKNKIENVFERKSKPSPIDAIINLSKAMIKAGQNSNALEALLNALKEYPNSARLMATVGKAYEANENYQEAKKFYNKARKINPMFVSAHADLGELYLKLDDHEQALKYLEAAASISPNDAQRQLTMGKAYLKTGNPAKARDAFKIATKENDLEVQKDIGEAYMSAGMEEYAVQAFKKAIDADPSMIYLYNRLGIALRKKGRFEEAVEEYKKAIKIVPDDEALYFNLSKAYIDMDDKSKAREAIVQALKIDPDFAEAKELLADLDIKK